MNAAQKRPEPVQLHDAGTVIQAKCSGCGQEVAIASEPISDMLQGIQDFMYDHKDCVDPVVRLPD